MSFCRSCAHALLWVPIVIFSLAGCATSGGGVESPTYQDDFGERLSTQPITPETVSEEQMFHQRSQVELKVGSSVPVGLFASNNFDPGPMVGIKGEIEAAKNLFLGISFDWAHSDQSKGVTQLIGDPTTLAGVTPDQLFKEYDRYTLLALFNYDVPLTKEFIAEKCPLLFRFGAGAGLMVVDSVEDPFLKDQIAAAGSEIKINPYYGFVFRPDVSLRWQVWEHGLVFLEASLDIVTPNSISVKINRQNSDVNGNIDFSSVNLAVGWAFEF